MGTHMVAMGKRWYDPAQARFYQGHNEQARNRVMTLMVRPWCACTRCCVGLECISEL